VPTVPHPIIPSFTGRMANCSSGRHSIGKSD